MKKPTRVPRILIVDEQVPMAVAHEFVLRRNLTCQVVRASDGASAGALLAGGDFDVILSDVRMPHVGGIALLQWLRVHRPELVRRVVFLTVDPTNVEAIMIANARVHPVLRKPCAAEALLKAVSDVLEQGEDE